MFRINDKKRDLQAHKEKLLQEIKYYEERITGFSNKSSNVYFGADSSDSEDGFLTCLDIGPTISELKLQDRMLKTCLQATQELTSVTVLESEVQVLVKEPDIGKEKPVSEPGLWREVTAECRIDLVPFTILFYVHQPSRRFSAASYRGLRVQPVKAAHEAELTASVLHSLTSPADVLETVRSYAGAYRSRRNSLARLADAHAGTLYMQPREEGGFVLRCGSVMQLSWRLENRSSPLAPFQHKMNFELDYMDESYLKIIKQAHRQLSDPSLQTHERTQLLSKIISTCIEAQEQDIESDADSKKLNKTRLDDDDSDVNPEDREEDRDREVMAPPKTIPKKSKPKGKENIDENRKAVKRSADEVDGSVKRAKTDEINASKNREVHKQTQKVKVAGRPDENTDKDNAKISQVSDKKVAKKSKNDNDKQSDDSDAKKKKNNDLNEKVAKNSKITDNKETDKAKNKTVEQSKQSDEVNSKSTKNIKTSTEEKKSNQTQPTSITKKSSNPVNAKKIVKDPNTEKVVKNNDNVKKNVNSETVKSKKDVPSDTHANNDAKATKAVNLESIKSKESVNTQPNAKKVTNSYPTNTKSNTAETSDKKNDKTKTTNTVKSNSANVKKAIADSNTDKVTTGKAKIAKPTDNVKKTVNDEAANNKQIDPETDNIKKSVNVKKNANTATSNAKMNLETEKINPNLANVNKTDKINSNPKVKKFANVGTENVNKALSSDSNKIKNDNTKKINTVKSKNNPTNSEKITLDTDKAKNNSDSTKVKNIANKVLTNKDTNSKNSIENSKNPKANDIKSKMVIKNHRNSSGKVKKAVVKPALLKESKIPQKKSPAYAAVLKQNPLRMSPRMQLKFKSSSDTNVQSKLFKPVTNIPRLLKKPAPKSK